MANLAMSGPAQKVANAANETARRHAALAVMLTEVEELELQATSARAAYEKEKNDHNERVNRLAELLTVT